MVSPWWSMCLSIHLSYGSPYFHFSDNNLSECKWIFTRFGICALILWRSGLGLLRGKSHLFLTELSAYNMSIFLFSNDNLSKCQWIFTNLVCALILLRSGSGLPMGKFH